MLNFGLISDTPQNSIQPQPMLAFPYQTQDQYSSGISLSQDTNNPNQLSSVIGVLAGAIASLASIVGILVQGMIGNRSESASRNQQSVKINTIPILSSQLIPLGSSMSKNSGDISIKTLFKGPSDAAGGILKNVLPMMSGFLGPVGSIFRIAEAGGGIVNGAKKLLKSIF